jgi:hypothetical protein
LKCVLTKIGWYGRRAVEQLRRDPLRQRHRVARAQADDLHAGDRAQLGDDLDQARVAEAQRIAAGDQHVLDRRGAADVVEGRRERARSGEEVASPTLRWRVQCRQYTGQLWVT